MQALAGSIDGWTKELWQVKSASDRIEMDLEALAKDEAETRENLKVCSCLNRDRVHSRCSRQSDAVSLCKNPPGYMPSEVSSCVSRHSPVTEPAKRSGGKVADKETAWPYPHPSTYTLDPEH